MLFIVISGLLLIYFSALAFRKTFAPKIIFWSWFFIVMLLYAFGNKMNFRKFEKRFYEILFFLLLVAPLILLVPFVGAALLLRFHESFIG
jgi:hypothetical protein